jgi:FkbM family methyltransferase
MGPLQRIWKPWFIYRPSQLLARALGAGSSAGSGRLGTAWGMTLHVDRGRDIGRSIVTTGVFDLAVSETLARLIEPGGRLIDAGANVGYMTLLGAVAAGPTGHVSAFEPHPDLFRTLERNVREAPEPSRLARVSLHHTALGDQDGAARLLLPPDFGSNDGTARIVTDPGASDRTVSVRVRRLDDVLAESGSDRDGPGSGAVVLKVDVEGHEPQVLAGAARTLQARRITHVVFEDHDVTRSEAVRLLRDAGYRLFALGWSMRRLRLEPLGSGLSHAYEAPNFVATIDPDRLRSRCGAPGWQVLRPWLGRAMPR